MHACVCVKVRIYLCVKKRNIFYSMVFFVIRFFYVYFVMLYIIYMYYTIEYHLHDR